MQNPCLFFQKQRKSRHIFNLFNLKEILYGQEGCSSVEGKGENKTGVFFPSRCSILTSYKRIKCFCLVIANDQRER
jgi:hypothetical protein